MSLISMLDYTNKNNDVSPRVFTLEIALEQGIAAASQSQPVQSVAPQESWTVVEDDNRTIDW
ncbi:hypothetical protein [Sphingobacterium multivorum]|uniref:Uncharacterized protein n=1 Tax=Sphingobacterium multivorum TaxID=28454 RepID=A0A653XV10_SPHMU|nr:hypothetical protein [Sphingobacterium multivorum]VXC34056.1 conserved hypothetical protein [Sphingobacterium multivorum]